MGNRLLAVWLLQDALRESYAEDDDDIDNSYSKEKSVEFYNEAEIENEIYKLIPVMAKDWSVISRDKVQMILEYELKNLLSPPMLEILDEMPTISPETISALEILDFHIRYDKHERKSKALLKKLKANEKLKRKYKNVAKNC